MSTAGRVLIVDDEERIREFLSRLLSRAGYEPLVAAEGETALALIRRESPDVVLLDVRMPGLDGLEVLRRAKVLDATLPVVMMTAYGLVRGAVEAIQAGASDYLEKPFDEARLVRAVRVATAAREPRQTITVIGDRVQDGDSLRELMGPSEAVARISVEVARVARSRRRRAH
jgi:DNA-binding NtrC family response regulator